MNIIYIFPLIEKEVKEGDLERSLSLKKRISENHGDGALTTRELESIRHHQDVISSSEYGERRQGKYPTRRKHECWERKNHSIGPDGLVSGAYDDNPYFHSMIYEVDFPDGQIKEYTPNFIVENMLTQVDSNDHSLTMMKTVMDF